MTGISRYLFLLLLVSACNQAASVTNSTQQGDTTMTDSLPAPVMAVVTANDSAAIRQFRKRMEVIDDSIYYYQVMHAMMDTVPLELQLFRKRPVKLKFGTHGTYYFTHGGDIFARQLFWSDENIIGQFFLKDTAVVDFKTTLFMDNWPLLRVDPVLADKRKTNYRRDLDSMMKRFPGVMYRLR